MAKRGEENDGFPLPSADPSVLLGRFAGLLAEGGTLSPALHALAAGLPVRTVVLRSADGELLGVGGEALQVMQAVSVQEPDLELPVPGPEGRPLALLSIRGARPSQLPVLRAAAAVLGLAVPAHGSAAVRALVDDREREQDELADALHDGPMQTLMVARYAADAALRGADLEPARASVQAAVVELRELVWSLRPRGASGLVPALEQWAATRPLELDLPASGVEVEPAVAALAYRVVQAAGPSRVRVALQAEAICVEINSGLPSAQRWARRAEALGCRLTATADQCTLLLPRAAGSFSTDVRTTS